MTPWRGGGGTACEHKTDGKRFCVAAPIPGAEPGGVEQHRANQRGSQNGGVDDQEVRGEGEKKKKEGDVQADGRKTPNTNR